VSSASANTPSSGTQKGGAVEVATLSWARPSHVTSASASTPSSTIKRPALSEPDDR
jgi:hypothetical protein